MSRILVTGASGFIGRAVVTAFADSEYQFRAAMRQQPHPPFPEKVEVWQSVDLTQPIDWRSLLHDVDRIIHLAGLAHTDPGVAPELYDRVNRAATAQLATAAVEAGVSQFVFVSSIRAQSGPSADHVITERDVAAPTDAYGRSKLAAEAAVRASGVPFTILRPVVLYGPGVKGNVALLLRAASSWVPLPIGSFTNRRSLLAVENFVSALAFVLSTPAAIGETYVIADPGMPPRLPDVIAILREAQGRRPLILPMPTRLLQVALHMMGRADLWERLGGDLQVNPGRLIAAGWRPAHTTRSGLLGLVNAATPRKSSSGSRSTDR